jgi:hypothetical protein
MRANVAESRAGYPGQHVTAMARDTSGFPGAMPSTISWMAAKSGGQAITAAKPTRDAVLKIGSTEALVPSFKLRFRPVREGAPMATR